MSVIESSGKAFSSATEGIPWWVKALIVAGGVGAGIYIIYYAVSNIVGGFTGNDCNNPNSACYQALQPYVKAYETCANEYAKYLNQYLEEDAENGTGFTQSQLSQLNYLKQCMDSEAKNIANTAKQYNNDPIQTLVYVGAYVFGAIGTAYAFKVYASGLKTKPVSGSAVASMIRNAMIRMKIALGKITSTQASGLQEQNDDIISDDTASNEAFFNDLAEEDVIDSDVADEEIEETDEEITEDDMDTVERLGFE